MSDVTADVFTLSFSSSFISLQRQDWSIAVEIISFVFICSSLKMLLMCLNGIIKLEVQSCLINLSSLIRHALNKQVVIVCVRESRLWQSCVNLPFYIFFLSSVRDQLSWWVVWIFLQPSASSSVSPSILRSLSLSKIFSDTCDDRVKICLNDLMESTTYSSPIPPLDLPKALSLVVDEL